jgi:hypothetical protein
MQGHPDLVLPSQPGNASSLSEAVEAADAEAPRSAADTVPVGGDVGAEATASDGLGVEERHGCVWVLGRGS